MNILTKSSPFILYLLVTPSPLGIDLHLPALIDIKQYFNIDNSLAQLSILVFVFSMGIGELLFGFLSEYFGKRKMGYLGSWLFILGSIGVILIKNYDVVLLCRILQGLGASALSVIAYATVNENYQEEEAAIIFSTQSGFLNIIPAVAPVIGAMLLTIWSWQLIFIFFVIYGVMILWQFHTQFNYQDNPIKRNYIDIMKKLMFDRQFILFSLICVYCLGFIMTYLNIAPILMMDTFGTTIFTFSVCFGVNAAVISIVSFSLKKIIDKVGAMKCVLAGLLLLSIASFGLFITTINIITFWAFIILGSIGFALALGPSIAFALANHQNHSSIASGVLGFCYMSFSPILAFFVLSLGGINTTTFGGFFTPLGIILLGFVLYKQRKTAL
ncbi:MFS transporter [Pasteurella skyensis]|uniref:MFS transporter n=1 Tax=Phocoenobacter skyensis TaxID=97481 RepID=A0AAJ6N9D5_9PAST|nr:MFS transporter [Pasteurella skyensis]MDP8162784.1 MFS transporter [Pasteurella skyensis]MDP8172629.1 MFS transporter [Pasteurella skyensis]MDP8177657.1 MFS transporter [Pasteurella skyensis]MDP8179129.1 MFS transporter [Pasteurella skyensis]MDP8183186.1 MFS transporter [Pasteurella skyensis]